MANPDDAGFNVLLIGNPGTGKSTILNGLVGKSIFKAGVSYGKGLTFQLQKHREGMHTFIDTPGLSDPALCKQAATAIATALKENGYYKVFFVMVLVNGRVKAEDVTTMRLVLDAAPITNYGIIVNQVPPRIYRELMEYPRSEDPSPFERECARISRAISSDTSHILLLPRDDELEDATDAVMDFPALRSFIETTPGTKIASSEVKQLSYESFEEMTETLEGLLRLEALQHEVQDERNSKRPLLDRSFGILEFQVQMACFRKQKCSAMKRFGTATDNARVPCQLEMCQDMQRVTVKWKALTPRDLFHYNNEDVKKAEMEKRLQEKGLLPREEDPVRVEFKCKACGTLLHTIHAADTLEFLHHELQALLVHDKQQPLIYNQATKLHPALPNDAAQVCDLAHSDCVDRFVMTVRQPDILHRISRSLKHGLLKKILEEKAQKAAVAFGDPKKTYVRIGLGFKAFESYPSQPVLELWPKHCSSPIHQHGGCAGSVRVVHGKLAFKLYNSLLSETPMTFRGDDCGLNLGPKPTEVLILRSGETTWLNRQSWFVHSMECANDTQIVPEDFALSIHFYKSCTDEFAFIKDDKDAEGNQEVKRVQPKNDLFWNYDLIEKGHRHYLTHYGKTAVPNMQEVMGEFSQQGEGTASSSYSGVEAEVAKKATVVQKDREVEEKNTAAEVCRSSSKAEASSALSSAFTLKLPRVCTVETTEEGLVMRVDEDGIAEVCRSAVLVTQKSYHATFDVVDSFDSLPPGHLMSPVVQITEEHGKPLNHDACLVFPACPGADSIWCCRAGQWEKLGSADASFLHGHAVMQLAHFSAYCAVAQRVEMQRQDRIVSAQVSACRHRLKLFARYFSCSHCKNSGGNYGGKWVSTCSETFDLPFGADVRLVAPGPEHLCKFSADPPSCKCEEFEFSEEILEVRVYASGREHVFEFPQRESQDSIATTPSATAVHTGQSTQALEAFNRDDSATEDADVGPKNIRLFVNAAKDVKHMHWWEKYLGGAEACIRMCLQSQPKKIHMVGITPSEDNWITFQEFQELEKEIRKQYSSKCTPLFDTGSRNAKIELQSIRWDRVPIEELRQVLRESTGPVIVASCSERQHEEAEELFCEMKTLGENAGRLYWSVKRKTDSYLEVGRFFKLMYQIQDSLSPFRS